MVKAITLPNDPAFYTTPYSFSVSLVRGACKYYNDPGQSSKAFRLTLDPVMRKTLDAYGNTHDATVAEIANSSIQFFRTSRRPTDTLDHLELQFMLAYDFGRVLTSGAKGVTGKCLGPASAKSSMRHSEAIKKTTEMFGYGLALHYVASALGIPADWFTFIVGSDLRPDFWAHLSPEELTESNPTLLALGPSGQRIYVEVKARVGWDSMREDKDSTGLLLACARKAETCQDGILLSILIGLPARSDSPRRTPHILVADPNDPPQLSQGEQAAFLLERYLLLAERYGLDLLELNILKWMQSISLGWTDRYDVELKRLEHRLGTIRTPMQPLLPQREIEGRSFQGRYFYSLIERLGRPRYRRLTIEEAHAAVSSGSLGTKYFVGVDVELVEIVSAKDADRLCRFGVRGKSALDLAAKSAFRDVQLELDKQERAEIRRVIKRQLDLWRKTGTW